MSAEQQYTPTTAETHEERQERSYLAAAHNQGNSREGRLHAAQKYSELHEKRTGEKVDPNDLVKDVDEYAAPRMHGKDTVREVELEEEGEGEGEKAR